MRVNFLLARDKDNTDTLACTHNRLWAKFDSAAKYYPSQSESNNANLYPRRDRATKQTQRSKQKKVGAKYRQLDSVENVVHFLLLLYQCGDPLYQWKGIIIATRTRFWCDQQRFW